MHTHSPDKTFFEIKYLCTEFYKYSFIFEKHQAHAQKEKDAMTSDCVNREEVEPDTHLAL